jgi:hypothetical protein
MILGRQNRLIREVAVSTPLLKISLLLCAVLFLASCASNTKKDAVKNANYTADRNGISLKLNAAEKLNLTANAPHTLALSVIQLNSSKAALALSKNSADLDNLLSGNPTSDAAVMAVDRYVIQPSAVDEITVGRVQDTQVIVIYAGYYDALLEKRVRLYEIPVKVTSKGWFKPTYSGSPLPLNLSINLGQTSIMDISIIKSNSDDEDAVTPNQDNPTLNGAQPPSNAPPSKVMAL